MPELETVPIETPVEPPKRAPLTLTRSRKHAHMLVSNQLKIGQAIREQRLGDMFELEQARLEKQEWVVRTTELLTQLFSDTSVAERVNDWVGPILPEYAEFPMFVELFGHEMKHRLARLQAVLPQIEQTPEPIGASVPRVVSSKIASAPTYVDASAPQPVAQVAAQTLSAVVPTQAPAPAPAPDPREAESTMQTSTRAEPPARINTSGLLIVRGTLPDDVRRHVAQFLDKLGLHALAVINASESNELSLLDRLEEHR
jgi:hypothetical protein